MRRNVASIVMAGLMFTLPATLGAGEQEVFKGHVVDTLCYTKLGHVKATAAEHDTCAKECAAKGLFLGIVTDGDGVFKILGPYAEGNYAKLLEFVGKDVEVTGTRSHAEDYSQAIDATKVALAKVPTK